MRYLLYAYFIFLPFQIALNPAQGVDLASIRVITLLLFFSWLTLSLLRKKVLIPTDKTSVFLYFFLTTILISFSFAENISWSLRKAAFIFSLAPIYIVTQAIIKTFDQRLKLYYSIVIGASMAALTGILQFLSQFVFGISQTVLFWGKMSSVFLGNTFGSTVQEYSSWLVNIDGKDFVRVFSFFPDPHMFSFFLGLSLPLSAYLAFRKSSTNRFLWILCFFIILTADLLTFSRGGYVALLSAVLMSVFIFKPKRVALLILPFIFLVLFSPINERFISTFNPNEGSNSVRMENWQQAVSIIKNYPWGVGIGNYSLEIDSLASYRKPIYAHNLYLDVAAELGLLGLLGLAGFLFSALIKMLKKSSEPLALASGISLVIYLVHSLFDTSLYSVHVLPLLLSIIAIQVNDSQQIS